MCRAGSEQDDDDRDDRAADDDKWVVGDHDEVVIVGTRVGWVTASVQRDEKEENYRRWLSRREVGGGYFRCSRDRLTFGDQPSAAKAKETWRPHG